MLKWILAAWALGTAALVAVVVSTEAALVLATLHRLGAALSN